MKGVVYDTYGGPTEMRVREIADPEPGPGEVRVRVRAGGINAADWHIYRGDPWVARLTFGLRRPSERGLGTDVAGIVDAVGPDVTAFTPGDGVFGEIGGGSVADVVIAEARKLALKPSSLTFEEAAAVPMAALTAYQGYKQARLAEGDGVLVIGASGGVGHMAVQMAKALGAGRVVAVCSGRNAEWVAQCGADRVIDYTRESVLDADEKFDLVYDTVATTPLRKLRKIMWPKAVYAPAGALGGSRLLGPIGPLIRSVATAPFISQRVKPVIATSSGEDLAAIAELIDAGKIKPRIEKLYAFEDFAQACLRLEGNHVGGKLVISAPAVA
jgi:NADPH:quinone reductase-like Zn-dependent oxidoreductase